MKKLWEELNILQPIPQCTCDFMKNCVYNSSGSMIDIISQNKLIQFLMGLNEYYYSIRSQILVLDPLPYVNKSYFMILRVEKQKVVQLNFLDSTDSSNILVSKFMTILIGTSSSRRTKLLALER